MATTMNQQERYNSGIGTNALYTGPRTNPDYLVVLTQQDRGVIVTAHVPQDLNLDINASYEQPFSQLLNDSSLSKLARLGGYSIQSQALTFRVWQGSSDFSQQLTLDFVAQEDPIKEIRAPLLALLGFVTPRVDRYGLLLEAPGPHVDVTKLPEAAKKIAQNFVTAVRGSSSNQSKAGSLTDTDADVSAPADRLSDSDKSAYKNNLAALRAAVVNQISVRIGSYMYLPSIVVESVSITHAAGFDAVTGWPLHVRVDVRYSPYMQVVFSDLESMYLKPADKYTPPTKTVAPKPKGTAMATDPRTGNPAFIDKNQLATSYQGAVNPPIKLPAFAGGDNF